MVIGMRQFSDSPVIVTALLVFLMMILSLYTSISGLIKAEMFPPHVRALGVGFSYAVGNAILVVQLQRLPCNLNRQVLKTNSSFM